MTWVLIALALAAGVEWRRVALALAVAAPVLMAGLITAPWWRARPVLSMRATRFCEAVSGELRAGHAPRLGGGSRDFSGCGEISRCCRQGGTDEPGRPVAKYEFSEIGPEPRRCLARADGLGVSPAALFDEIGALALAQVEVAHEVSIASAPARATGAVLLRFRSSPSAGPSHGAGSTAPAAAGTASRGSGWGGSGFAGLTLSVLILREPDERRGVRIDRAGRGGLPGAASPFVSMRVFDPRRLEATSPGLS